MCKSHVGHEYQILAQHLSREDEVESASTCFAQSGICDRFVIVKHQLPLPITSLFFKGFPALEL
jgi:hypothetical protein